MAESYIREHKSSIFMCIIAFLIIAFIAAIALFGVKYVNKIVNNNLVMSKNIERMKNEINLKFQTLSAGITFDQKRKRTLLYLRDIISDINPELKPSDAYEIAEVNLEHCDRFKRVDPLLLVAVQKVESTFNSKAVSTKGALGINQIWPSTGRILCRIAGWEYNKKALIDIEKSTYLAVLYLDLLHVEYKGTERLILADYNGGPKNAYLLSIGSDNCSKETQLYVENVLTFRDKLRKKMEKSI